MKRRKKFYFSSLSIDNPVNLPTKSILIPFFSIFFDVSLIHSLKNIYRIILYFFISKYCIFLFLFIIFISKDTLLLTDNTIFTITSLYCILSFLFFNFFSERFYLSIYYRELIYFFTKKNQL